MKKTDHIQWHVISLGVSQPILLDTEAVKALSISHLVIGSDRQLELLKDQFPDLSTKVLPKPFSSLKSFLSQKINEENANNQDLQHWIFLASGDGLFFGIGSWLKKTAKQLNLKDTQITFYPGVSSIQAACHKVGIETHTIKTISLHGRPLNVLRNKLREFECFAILTDENNNPHEISRFLIEDGWGKSQIWFFDSLGYSDELIIHSDVENFDAKMANNRPSQLNLLILKTDIQSIDSSLKLPSFPGIRDEAFITSLDDLKSQNGKGLISKREIRINALMLLEPKANEVGWDVGAGCGALTVEWARWSFDTNIYAIEKHSDRFACLRQNIEKFGVTQQINAVLGLAEDSLQNFPSPNRIFVGGNGGKLFDLLVACWDRLLPNGALVVSLITEEAEYDAMKFDRQMLGSNSVKRTDKIHLAVSKRESIADLTLMKPNIPVTLMVWYKSSMHNVHEECHEYS